MAPFQDFLHYETPNYAEDQFKLNSLYKALLNSSINKKSQEADFQ